MKFWQATTWVETEQLPEIARFAEEVGFDGLMGGDHAVYPETVAADYPYTGDGLPPMNPKSEYPDQWVSIAAMAAVTSKIQFTTGVYVLPARNPHEVARATATLGIMTNDRFVLGVGAGWMKEEFDIYGIPFERRGKRLDECIDVIRKLWSGEMVEHHGEFYDFPRVILSPTPANNPPIYIGGDNALALKRAAYLGDGWIGAGNSAEQVPAVLNKINGLRKEAGRDHLPFETMVGITDPLTPDLLKHLRDQGMTSSVSYPFKYSLGEKSSIDDKKRHMEKFARDIIQKV